jgi:hypothetical protein
VTARILGTLFAALLTVAACSPPDSPVTTSPRATTEQASASASSSFINKVWVVTDSKQVAPGELRVFLSDGTLLMASAHGTPALGTWHYRDGRLTITEEGLKYAVDILELNERKFHIRIHGSGEPIDIVFEPAQQPSVPVNQ